MPLRITVIVLATLLPACSPAASQDESVEHWTARLAENWSRAWTADVELDASATPLAVTWQGHLLRDGNGRYRFETTTAGWGQEAGRPAMRMTEISDGSTMWKVMEMPRIGLPPTVIERSVRQGEPSMSDPSSGQFSWLEGVTAQMLEMGTFEVAERSDGTVTLKSGIPDLPATPELGPAGLTIVLDRKTALPRRLDMAYGSRFGVSITYENARFASPRDWDDETFRYDPPAGARVTKVNR